MNEDPLGFKSGVNLYAYAGNSPSWLIDPTGTSITVKGDYQMWLMAVEYLNASPTAASIISQLQTSSQDYTVYIYSRPLSGTNLNWDPETVINDYVDEQHLVNWDPHSLSCVTHGRQSPALTLLHELAHALLDPTTPRYFDQQYDNTREKAVITGPETAVAKELGEGTRTDHRGSYSWILFPNMLSPSLRCK